MTSGNQKHQSSGISSFLMWTFILIVAYILSVGPAAWIDKKLQNQRLSDVLEIAYTPALHLLLDTPLNPAGEWYLRQWIGEPLILK